VLLHVRTVKGKGFAPAEVDARTFHGVGPNVIHPTKGSSRRSLPDHVCPSVRRRAYRRRKRRHARIESRRDARRDGRESSPKLSGPLFRCRDRRSARRLLRRGAATSGLKPVCAIYSTFLQRAYDQVVHDVVYPGACRSCRDRSRGLRRDDGRRIWSVHIAICERCRA